MGSILHAPEVFAISPEARQFHMFHKPSLQGNLMGWICSKLNEIFLFKWWSFHRLMPFIAWTKTTLVPHICEHFPVSLVSSDSEFENEGSPQSLALGWCHRQTSVLFSELIRSPSNLLCIHAQAPGLRDEPTSFTSWSWCLYQDDPPAVTQNTQLTTDRVRVRVRVVGMIRARVGLC